MSQEDVDLVMRAIRAAIRQPKPDFETVNALYHPDHVIVSVVAAKLGGEAEAVGAAGFKAWLEDREGVINWEGELEGAVDVAPGTVLAVLTIRLSGRSSGAHTEQRVWSVVTVRDGKITRTETYTDPAEALEAVRLRE
jgi:ketosteroid isomerase-like protein